MPLFAIFIFLGKKVPSNVKRCLQGTSGGLESILIKVVNFLKYKTIIVETNKQMTDTLSATLRKAPNFELLSTFKDANSALGQSRIYNPNLFLIDVDAPQLLEMLPAFVDLFPKAVILATMSNWNAEIAYKAQKAHVVGCIIKPFKAEEIIETINLYQKRGKPDPSRIISFFSPKGRSGRTTLAALLALDLAEKTKESVALIDGDLQFGDLPIFFDLEPRHTVVDATHDIKLLTPVSFAPYFHKIKENLWILSSPERPEYAELVETDSFIEVVKMAGHIFRYLLIDLPAGFNPISLEVSNFADTNFVVAMINTGLEIEHMRRTLDMFRERRKKHKVDYPIFTRVNPCNDEEREKLELRLGYPITAIFPNEYNLVSVANSGRILYGLSHDTKLMQTVDKLSDRIISGDL